MPLNTSVSKLVDRYDAFLLDQFGVLHDGSTALPGAVDCFARLVAAGKKCVVLSNTSRRGGAGAGKLKAMGFAADALSGFVASGELAYQYMINEGWCGKKALWFGWQGGFLGNTNTDYVDGLDLAFAPAGEADFVLCQGTQNMNDGVSSVPVSLFETGVIEEVVSSVLDACIARGLPMVCCNPDFTALQPGGGRGHMPGTLAREYEKRGGTVISFGKPSTKAFEAGLALLADSVPGGIPRERVCHVGDSLHHDIAGANASGIDCLWVTATGIHAEELGLAESATTVDGDDVERIVKDCGGHTPTHVTMRFSWEG
jgi:ribonucleotide monophosphatase NagD (HAD superfamily)